MGFLVSCLPTTPGRRSVLVVVLLLSCFFGLVFFKSRERLANGSRQIGPRGFRSELDSALRRIRDSGRSIFTLTVEDFPLPSFENDAEALREELRFESGFVVVEGLPIDRYTET